MPENGGPEPWDELARLSETGTPEALAEFIEQLSSGDATLAMSRLTREAQNRILTKLSPDDAARLLGQLPDVQALALIDQMHPKTAAGIIDELPSDEQADLIGDMNAKDAEAILREMDPEEAADARALSRYADDVAGGLMVTEFLRFPEQFRVADVVDDLRTHADKYRDYEIQYAYVCDADKRLTGVLRLRDLLLADPRRSIAEIMIREPLSVSDKTHLDELADFFDRHHFLGVPVVDAHGKLAGVVQKGAVDEAWRNRQGSDYLKSQGIVGDEIRTMPLLRRTRSRLAWLCVNILLNIAAASVIAIFQDTLQAVIALAIFLPIISDMSGCSGNQAVAVSLRELALGLVRPRDLFYVWMKEISVGLINGVVLGLLIALVAWIWHANPFLGLVVGIALCLNTVVAVSIGGSIPLILKRLKVDPAIAAGPILTTITDMCGFFFVLGLASLLLNYLIR